MKNKYIYLLIAGVFCAVGCQTAEKQPSEIFAGIFVEVSDGSAFPKEFAGTWICEENKWQIILEEDGRVSWVHYPLGYVWMEPGIMTNVEMKMDRVSVFAPTEVKAVYDPETTIFNIDIVLPFYEIAMGNDTLTGHSTDIFAGPMDGEKGLWVAEWLSDTAYIVDTAGLKDHELEPYEINRGKVVFRRHYIVYE